MTSMHHGMTRIDLTREEVVRHLRETESGADTRGWLCEHFNITDEDLADEVTLRVPRERWEALKSSTAVLGESVIDAARMFIAHAEVEYTNAVPDDPILALERRHEAIKLEVAALASDAELSQATLTEVIDISRKVDGLLMAARAAAGPNADRARLLRIARWMYDHKLPTAQAPSFRDPGADAVRRPRRVPE